MLSDPIPSSFENMKSLLYVDVSNNKLEGHLPTNKVFQESSLDVFKNNKGLCGVLLLILASAGVFFIFCRNKREINEEQGEIQKDLFCVWNYDGNIVYDDIIEEAVKLDWVRRVNIVKELAYTMRVTEKCDMYNFGALTPEVLIGKHPGELISSLTSLSLLTCQNVLLKDILDGRLSPPTLHTCHELFTIAKLAFSCLDASPESQPTIKHVSQELSKSTVLDLELFHTITVGQLMHREI
ncbi:hypothetical protein GIB67_031406 [Kingdonia uniflora]|uniref:non-specific serine/threonine protein kinase n=1 Tax=Kingdonia uniflora TaxID=39325 RepID=A0A7J7MBB7_9MAGN|nr:hypothetical protein GIB67_031406 [Kingdonia uniflora]